MVQRRIRRTKLSGHDELAQSLAVLSIDDRSPLILCDLGYGLPKEARPRKEKLLAIARQLVNFLLWQQKALVDPARIWIVECPTDIQDELMARIHQVWKQQSSSETGFPLHIQCIDQPLTEFPNAVYLSPDADQALDIEQPPPSVAVVGLLIDRRIQVNRSRERAELLSMPARRWPLENSSILSPNEPLNVDCILEALQQWHWNTNDQSMAPRDAFERATVQALQHHQARHPLRPQHKME